MQKVESLGHHLHAKEIDAGRVGTRPGEAGDEAEPDRIFGDREHDRNTRRRGLGGKRYRRAYSGDHRHAAADEIGHEHR